MAQQKLPIGTIVDENGNPVGAALRSNTPDEQGRPSLTPMASHQNPALDAKGDPIIWQVNPKTGQRYPISREALNAQSNVVKLMATAAPQLAAGAATEGMSFLPALATQAGIFGATNAVDAAINEEPIAPAFLKGAAVGAAGTGAGALAERVVAPLAKSIAGKTWLIAANPWEGATPQAAGNVLKSGRGYVVSRNTDALRQAADAQSGLVGQALSDAADVHYQGAYGASQRAIQQQPQNSFTGAINLIRAPLQPKPLSAAAQGLYNAASIPPDLMRQAIIQLLLGGQRMAPVASHQPSAPIVR